MNKREEINKILHTHIDVNQHEDYTNYKELISAIEQWHEKEKMKEITVIKFLWDIIDDIDTCSDMAKHDDKSYRQMVEKLQKKRWETGITTDGYKLDLTKMNSDL